MFEESEDLEDTPTTPPTDTRYIHTYSEELVILSLEGDGICSRGNFVDRICLMPFSFLPYYSSGARDRSASNSSQIIGRFEV